MDNLTNEQIKDITDIILNNNRQQAINKLSKKYNISKEYAKKYIPTFRKTYNIGIRHNSNYDKGSIIYTVENMQDMKSIIDNNELNKALDIIVDKYNTSRNYILKKLAHEGYYVKDIELLEGEEFKQYKDTNYYVSNKGRVYVRNKGTKRLMSTKPSSNGYVTVMLYTKEGHHAYKIHRLVAELFIPNPENKPQVDHIDTNRSNNCVENLRWVTETENMNNELTRMHMSIALGVSSYGFTITTVNNDTGEISKFSSVAQLYKYLGLDYIPKYVGTQQYKNYTIFMEGEDNDEYYIGKMLRNGLSKEDLIKKVTEYSESKEYHKYLNNKMQQP